MAKYRIEEINIGDEIYYEDKYMSNRHPYWKVVGKLDRSILIIESTDPESKLENRMIDFEDTRSFEVLPKSKV